MTRLPMSTAASGLLRALVGRAGVERDRILLSGIRSVEWQSLTFAGERHLIELRIAGPWSAMVAERLCSGLADAKFSIPAILVADIAIVGEPVSNADGSTGITIEALTIAAD
ncbi:MAG: hypothetical protein ABIO80_07800 [Sphingomicrobium sp.]